jgi:hypothetical protein
MRTTAVILGTLMLVLAALPAASAHERYFSSDNKYLLILGEQNEPVYTYDFTNLDFFVRDNSTGDPIEGVEETVTATLIAPNGEELSRPLEQQFGSPGEYAFDGDYILTLPGQYKVRLEGEIDGTDVTGEYLLPGPRGDSTDIYFPHSDLEDLRALQQRIDALEAQIDQMESGDENADEGGAGVPGPMAFASLVALGLALVMLRRRNA